MEVRIWRKSENYKYCPDCGAKLTVDVEVKTKGPEQVEEKDDSDSIWAPKI